MLEPVDWLRVVLGGALFVAPGLTWTWALVGSLPWPYRVPIALVAAFTIMPGALFVLHLFLGVPLSLEVYVFAAAFFTVAGAVLWANKHAAVWDLDRTA